MVDRAVDNYTNEVSVPAARGIIYDRNGYILARNLASYNVVITPANLPDDETDIQRIYREVSELTDVPVGGPVTDESLSRQNFIQPVCRVLALPNSLACRIPWLRIVP